MTGIKPALRRMYMRLKWEKAGFVAKDYRAFSILHDFSLGICKHAHQGCKHAHIGCNPYLERTYKNAKNESSPGFNSFQYQSTFLHSYNKKTHLLRMSGPAG